MYVFVLVLSLNEDADLKPNFTMWLLHVWSNHTDTHRRKHV